MADYKNIMTAMEKGYLIGIDIGLSAVKICKLSPGKKGNYKIESFAMVPLTEAAIIEDEIQKEEEVIGALIEAKELANVGKATIACIGMDGPNTVTKRLQVPNGSREDVEDNILWEADQYIPFGAEDSELDFAILGEIPEDDVVDTIVAAIRSDVSEKYKSMVTSAGYTVKVIDLNMFALNNIFEVSYADRLEEMSDVGTIIIDFGAQTTKIIVYKDGGPVLTKEISVGGVLITEEIQRQMGLSYSEAELLKIGGNLPEEILTIVQNQLQVQLSEIKKVLNFYIAAGSSEQVGYCLVTGGSSRLPGLLDQLKEVVGVQVEVFNPFNYISINPKIEKKYSIEDIGTMGLVAIGLGLRKI